MNADDVAHRVLVVEDEADIARTIAASLEGSCVEVSIAQNGADGLCRARALRPHAILLDVELPILDGFEVFHELRKDAKLRSTPVIFLSARSPRGGFMLARELGAFACLTKPFEPEKLRAVVMRAIDGQAAAPPARPLALDTPEKPCDAVTVDRPDTPARPPFVAVVDGDVDLPNMVGPIVREALGADAELASYRARGEAARGLAASPPDVILLGTRLLDGGGLDALQELKRMTRLCDVPVILLTGAEDWGLVSLALEAGAEAYAPKPIERGLLASLLRQVYRPIAADGPGSSISDREAQGLKRGTVLASRYVVEEPIGSGGMGAVYRVRDRLRDAVVALKVMLPSLLARERAVKRFKREADIMLRLTHPKIVRVFDVGHDRDRRVSFFTMELLAGETLRRWLEETKGRGLEVRLDEALDVIEQVLEALQYAHATLVHRDLKPENIFLVDLGSLDLKILDFGVAKIHAGGKRFTSTSVGLGTAYYMAPEQQQNAGAVDPRADVYSVGVILYEMLTGRLPVGRFPNPSAIRRDVPAALDDIVLAALCPEPAGRPPTAAALLADLGRLRCRPAQRPEAKPAIFSSSDSTSAWSRRASR